MHLSKIFLIKKDTMFEIRKLKCLCVVQIKNAYFLSITFKHFSINFEKRAKR